MQARSTLRCSRDSPPQPNPDPTLPLPLPLPLPPTPYPLPLPKVLERLDSFRGGGVSFKLAQVGRRVSQIAGEDGSGPHT